MIPVTGDAWTVGIRRDADIDFCIWILLQDGLRVHPFEVHRDGDKTLRAAGLTEPNWREWFEKTVRVATDREASVGPDSGAVDNLDGVDLAELLFADQGPTADDIERSRQRFLERSVAGRWPQHDSVREELLRRWPQYVRQLKSSDSRKFESSMKRNRLLQSLTSEEVDELVRREGRLWDEIQQFRPLPPLHCYTVDYPSPVVETVPPASAVLGGVEPQLDSERFVRLVLEAAERLKSVC